MLEEKAPGRTDLPTIFLKRLYNGVTPVTSEELPSFKRVHISRPNILYVFVEKAISQS